MNKNVDTEKKLEKSSSKGPELGSSKPSDKTEDNEAQHEKKAETDKGTNQDEGVLVPEEYQKDTHALMQKTTTKHHISHVRSALSEKEDRMREAEMRSKDVPKEYSTVGGPSY
jgi:hypothetical protein